MFSTFKFARLVAASAALLAVTAHAELQVWKMTGTVYEELTPQGDPFVPPSSYYAHGKTVTVNYVVDTAATATDGFFYKSVLAFTVNGIGSRADSNSYIWPDGVGINGINVSPVKARADKVSFLSFNRLYGAKFTNVSDALNDFSTATANGTDVDYRVDFGSAGSVRVKPTSFDKQTIPAHCKSPLYLLIDPRCAPLLPLVH
ncbi:MAG TPA: hypothetical protein VFW93_16540 [Aquabacterium sp.]|uniref:hypothetical protein n=1 Tax=Aquabacterium sp. TaxID=1872578 RepID=UPI002E305374|nr:hypothetical protein [Aquabacterium sp.]HEX5357813.1 hypothetical protein [Aquabacterium sp.]